MIILEGVDRTGKTSVATALMDLLPGWSFSHQTKPCEHPFKYAARRVRDARPRVVYDRLHWSNYAYGRVYDGSQDLINFHQWRLMELALLSQGTMVIYMHDQPEAIKSRWGPDEMYDSAQLEQLLGHYVDLVGQCSELVTRLPYVCHDLPSLVHADGSPTTVLRAIAHEAEALATQVEARLPASVGFGSHAPRFMVVAEAPNDRCKPCGDFPRFPMDIGPAMDLFWEAMDLAGVQWWEGYYTNANAFRDRQHFNGYVRELEPEVILCLGNKAGDLADTVRRMKNATNLGPVVHRMPHPAYWRRFRYHELGTWKLNLAEALRDFLGNYMDELPPIHCLDETDAGLDCEPAAVGGLYGA